MKDLQAQRSALAAELETLEAKLPELDAAIANAPTEWLDGNAIGSPEATAAREAYSDAEERIRKLTSDIDLLDIKIARAADLAESGKRRAKATAEAAEAAAQLDRLTKSHDLVVGRIGEIQAEAEQAALQAQEAERAAAQAIAKATASGDSTAVQAAQSKMEAAIQAGQQAREKSATTATLTRALQAEADALSEQMEAARQREKDAKREAYQAGRLRLQAEWDEAAKALGEIGVKMLELGREHRETAHGLGRLDVPVFAPGERALTLDQLARMAGERAA